MSGRIRSVKPEWLEDEALLGCSAEARVISIGLLLLADDYGNGRGSEVYLSSRIFPLAESTETLANGVSELIKIHFVELYRLSGQTYFSIRNWKKHQKVDKPGKPRVPGPLDAGVEKVIESLARVSRLTPIPIPIPTPTSYPDPDPIYLETANREFETRAEIVTTQKPKSPKPKPEPTDAAKIRRAFLDGYAARLPKAGAYPWGARENKTACNWLRSVPLPEAMALVDRFFAWNRPEIIRAGYPFCTGSNSLVMKYIELKSDIAHPERRAFAAIADDTEHQDNRRAQNTGQTQRVLAAIAEERNHERMGQASRPGYIRGPFDPPIGIGDRNAVQYSQPTPERRSAAPLDQAIAANGQVKIVLEGTGSGRK